MGTYGFEEDGLMDRDGFLRVLGEAPLVASVQAPAGTPLAEVGILLAMARASLSTGSRVLRLQGAEAVERIGRETGAPVIGLVKRDYEGSEVYITPTLREVDELLGTGCAVLAVDGTPRGRPGGVGLVDLVARAHGAGRLVLADIDNVESARYALECGADLLSTTLSGYTAESRVGEGPDLGLVALCAGVQVEGRGVPVLAEGRYAEPWQVRAALTAGAAGVVIGGALNDPLKNTAKFAAAARRWREPVGAFDLGGTWLRFGLFSAEWELLESERIALPARHGERLEWMAEQVLSRGVRAVGISAGGVIEENQVVEAKSFVPDYIDQVFELPEGVMTVALNDGLATAWGHSRLPQWVGQRVATLALGTGVGAGVADAEDLLADARGDYPRLNDLYTPTGQTVEDLLGGLNLGSDPESVDQGPLGVAFRIAALGLKVASPQVTVLCGGVGLSPVFRPLFTRILDGMHLRHTLSPFGAEAGLYGAAALVLDPPRRFWGRFEVSGR